jgi:hypothetical protein
VYLCERTGGSPDLSLSSEPARDAGLCDRFASPSGNDGASGTTTDPYRTAERLVNALEPGETGCLEAGATFTEPDFEINVRAEGERSAPVTLRTAPGGRRAVVEGRLWVQASAHDVVFTDLTLNGVNPLARLRGQVRALPSPTVNGSRITFYDAEVTNNRTAICFAVGSVLGYGIAEDVQIRGSRIHDCGQFDGGDALKGQAINLEASRRAVVVGNLIYDNADRGVLIYPDAQGSVVAGNVIDGNGIGISFGGETAPAGWIYPAGTRVYPNDNAVERNVITNSRLDYVYEHWNVDGYYPWYPDPPEPQDNVLRENCLFHAGGAGRNVQDPRVGFSADGSNVIQPAAGPGYADRHAKDFRLTRAAGTCPAPMGPEDPLSATTEAASDITETSALLRLTVDGGATNAARTLGFQWGKAGAEAEGAFDHETVAEGGASPGAGSLRLAGLSPGTTYRYRAYAESSGGRAYGPERSFTTQGTPCTLEGTARSDLLYGSTGPDVICGGAGNDEIEGLSGDDKLYGGSGRDLIDGGPDDDQIEAKDGQVDTVYGGGGSDRIARDRSDVVDPPGAPRSRTTGAVPTRRALTISQREVFQDSTRWVDRSFGDSIARDHTAEAFRLSSECALDAIGKKGAKNAFLALAFRNARRLARRAGIVATVGLFIGGRIGAAISGATGRCGAAKQHVSAAAAWFQAGRCRPFPGYPRSGSCYFRLRFTYIARRFLPDLCEWYEQVGYFRFSTPPEIRSFAPFTIKYYAAGSCP